MKQQLISIQNQSQIVSQSQVQFLQILALCNQELNTWLEQQYNENPFFEKQNQANERNVTSSVIPIPHISHVHSLQRTDYTYPEPAVFEGKQLYHYLTEQLRYFDYTKPEWNAFSFLIENIEPNGYFILDLNTVSSQTSISFDTLKKCLSILQDLEPYGIFSPDMKSCFLKQLEKQNINIPKLNTVISENLEDLLYKRISPLQKKYKLKRDEIEEYHTLISKLNPTPIPDIENNTSSYIIPDIICRFSDGKLIPELNSDLSYDYSLSDYYLTLMNQTEDADLKKYLKSRYLAAKNILINIENRRKTLLRITEAVIEKQTDFFYNEGELYPMSMSQIAEICSISISTVSRAIQNKYIHNPYRTMKMKDLFVSSADTSSRNDSSVSPDNVKKQISRIIQTEDPKKPLNDDAIASLLKEQGIAISRRTVAKYRGEMMIPTSRERKEHL